MNEIVIGNTNVSIKEYKGQRVVTFKDIDTVHGRPDGTARRNFNRNKEHFIEGEDFYKITPNEFRTAIGSMDKRQQNDVTLLTESGYLMLAKSFTDKVAWDVQRALVKSYFRAKQETAPQYEQLKLEEKPYEYVDKFYKGQPVLTSADIEHFSGINHTRIDHALRRVCIENTDYIYLTRLELAEFKKENPKLVRNFSHVLVIFKSGFDKLMKHFGAEAETPKIMIEENKKSVSGVADESVCRLMGYIRREIKGIEALTYLLESKISSDDFLTLKNMLAKKLKAVGGWEMDTKTITSVIHSPFGSEYNDIFSGKRGMRYIR